MLEIRGIPCAVEKDGSREVGLDGGRRAPRLDPDPE